MTIIRLPFPRILTLTLLMRLASGSLFGQTAQITGRVTDPTGAVVPAATVSVTNANTGIKRDTATNEDGYYTVPAMQPGEYGITLQKEGFRAISRTGIKLLADDKLRIDFALQLGEQAEAINVTADAPLLRPDSPEVGKSITGREYDRLPLNQINRMRNPATFLYLTPGIYGNVNTNGADYTGQTNQIQINGSQWFNTELLVEGIPAGQNLQTGNFTDSAPSVDAIQEFKVQTSQMSAEYGRTGAGTVNFRLKSGTNAIHGTLYEYLRNDKLDARSWFAATRGVTRQNEFGVALGGPITLPHLYKGKDRTFFFFSYAGSRKRGLDNVSRVRIPTPAMVAGDFSANVDARGNLIPIFDPTTTRSNGQGGFIRDPFPGNIIPKDRMDPVALRVTPFIPAPNAASGLLNFQGFTLDKKVDPDAITFKIDHKVSSRQGLSFSFNYTNQPRHWLGSPLPSPLIADDLQETTSRTVRLTHNYFQSSFVNDLALGYNRYRNPDTPSTFGQGWPEKLGLTGVPGSAFPVFTFTDGYSSFGSAFAVDNIDQAYFFKDAVAWTRGKHVVKFGGEHRRIYANSRSFSNMSGTFSFNRQGTALPTSPSTSGDGFASFLLGEVQSASVSYPAHTGLRRPYWGFFVQDDIKVAPSLTLNLGLRFEFEQAPYEAADRYSTIDLSLPNPGAGNLPGALIFAGSGAGRTGRRTFANTDYSGIGPRFGLAWQVDGKTVIRGGYGLYYSGTYFNVSSAGFNISGSFASLDNGVTPAFHLRDGFPQNFNRSPRIDPTFQNGQSGSYIQDTGTVMPRTQNWSFGVQRELTANLMAEAVYIGNHNTRQLAGQLVNLNQVDPKYLSLGSLLTQNINSPEARAAGIPIPYPGFNSSVAQALRPFPQYQGLSTTATAGNSIYHALQLSLRKRLSVGLSLDAHYSLSKNIGYTSSALSGGAGLDQNILQDNFSRQLERAILPIDITHAVLISYVYDLPLGPGKAFLDRGGVVGKLIGGWSVAGVHRYQSGMPLSLLMANNLPIFNRVLRPDRVSGQQASTGISNADFEPNSDRAINLNAFAVPAPFHFGTAPPAIQDLRGFPVLNEDFSLIKVTSLTERFSLETYAQFINAFNRHRFTGIGTTFNTTTFGLVSGASLPRFIQVGIRLRF